jgi:hypothetical protein
MIRSCCWHKIFIFFFLLKNRKRSNHRHYFRYWCYKSSCTISKLNQKAKKHIKFRPHNYQIQSHFQTKYFSIAFSF